MPLRWKQIYLWVGMIMRKTKETEESANLTTLGNGLLVRGEQIIGYILDIGKEGVYSPSGKVLPEEGEWTKETIDRHNKALAELEWEHLEKFGRGILYLSSTPIGTRTKNWRVGDWAGVRHISCFVQHSHHNMAGKDGRRDIWFSLNGYEWHGVNIGWGEITHVKRTKRERKEKQQ